MIKLLRKIIDKTCKNCIYCLFDDKKIKYYCDIDPDCDIKAVASYSGFMDLLEAT
ncbi:MAG: hypothetical protein ACYCSW_05250 [bacterium]